ncbi:carbon storage regulator CsrA [Sulfurospirillum sp. 1612]|uniref:carbon storage regulator CsrA n=1 Tax=Sulfurospirillum sp. 1612 TaxID=3094835 RepID=UPI002F95D351
MLILSRKIGESILIDETISITVVEVSKGVVRIGIDAPKDVLILRKELEEAVKDSNIQAVQKVNLQELSQLSQKLKK